MEEFGLLKEMIKAAPNTVALIFVVVLFLKYMLKRDEAHGELMKEIKTSCHTFMTAVSKETGENINRNTMALERNSEALGHASAYFANGSSK